MTGLALTPTDGRPLSVFATTVCSSIDLDWDAAVKRAQGADRASIPRGRTPSGTARPAPLPLDGSRRRQADRRGRAGEEAVSRWLADQGWQILGRRVRTPVGEIDVLAHDPSSQCLVAVEIKAHRCLESGLQALTARSRERITAALCHWRSEAPAWRDVDCRVDVIVLTPQARPYHLVNAWMAEDMSAALA